MTFGRQYAYGITVKLDFALRPDALAPFDALVETITPRNWSEKLTCVTNRHNTVSADRCFTPPIGVPSCQSGFFLKAR